MEFSDLRVPAAITLIGTLVSNTYLTWNHLPYFPIEFSQMGWGVPGAAGGYYIMSWGMCIAASFMLRMHVVERSALGVIGAVLMALLGLVNGNDVPTLQIAHGVVAASCFVVYIAYIYVNNGPMIWLVCAGIALVVGHAVVLTQLDVQTLLKDGVSHWPRVWAEAQSKHPVWINQFKATCQHTMLVAFFVCVFSIQPKAKSG